MAKDEKEPVNEGESEAASTRLPAPKRLAKWFAACAFDVEIVFTRNGVLSDDAPDPGADPGCVDDPIDEDEIADLRGLLAAYDLQDEEPSGERGVVGPPKDEPPPSSK
jgi:hypothetical protein